MRPGSHFSNEPQPLGGPPPAVADNDLDEEADELAKEHDIEEAPKANGSDSDYRPSARQSTRSRRAASRRRPPRRVSHYKVCRWLAVALKVLPYVELVSACHELRIACQIIINPTSIAAFVLQLGATGMKGHPAADAVLEKCEQIW